jgi:hypothetical protein
MERPMILTRPPSKLVFALGLAALAGCTPFPQLSSPASEAALAQPYPDLVPLAGLQTRLEASRITPETAPTIEARVTRLKDRAARLSGDVVDPATRSRMRAGVQE